jgi:hypothetical protein
MKIGQRGGVVAALAMMCMSHAAWATIWVIDCPGGTTNSTLSQFSSADMLEVGPVNFGVDPGALTGTGAGTSGTGNTAPDALGALLGTPSQGGESLSGFGFTASLSGGDTVQITGVCQQEIEIRTSGITVAGPSGALTIPQTPPTAGAIVNGIEGQVEVFGAQRVVFNDLLFGNTSAVSLPSSYPGSDTALLWVRGSSSVFIEDVVVQNSPVRGIFVNEDSSLVLESSTATENGTGDGNDRTNSGIEVADASGLQLGVSTASGVGTNSYPVDVTSNAGDGVYVTGSSAAAIYAGTISANGQKQIDLFGGSTGHISGNDNAQVTITANAASTDEAVFVTAGSALLVEQGVSITGGTSSGTAINLNADSAMLIQGSQVSGGATTIQASGGSSVFLAGGNLICNGSISSSVCTPAGGVVMQIDHVSSLLDLAGQIVDFDFPALGDNVFGTGLIELQSTADLGSGTPGGNISITWTGNISTEQNSSFRLQGGVKINGTVNLSQGSNGFFNKSNGGTNAVTSVLCPFISIPSAHVAGPANVSPALTLSGNIASTTADQCLSF